MKRSFFAVVCLTAVISLSVALPSGRTVVNPERDPLIYVFVPQEQLPEEFAERDTSPGAAAIAFLLREYQESLDILPPGGMWRVPQERGILAGYFLPKRGADIAGQYRFVSMVLAAGGDTILVVPASGSIVGSTTRLKQHQLPERNEPVLLDGRPEDWSGTDFARILVTAEPRRVEIAGTGREVPVIHARHWRSGGTGILRIGQVVSERRLYVSITTSEPIVRDTYYYFRLFQGDNPKKTKGDVIIPVSGSSGPVLFRGVDGSLVAVGQYALQGNFLEGEIRREYVSQFFADGRTDIESVDVAVGTGRDFDREIYTLITISFGEELPFRP